MRKFGGCVVFRWPLGPTGSLAGGEDAVECVDLGSVDYYGELIFSFL